MLRSGFLFLGGILLLFLSGGGVQPRPAGSVLIFMAESKPLSPFSLPPLMGKCSWARLALAFEGACSFPGSHVFFLFFLLFSGGSIGLLLGRELDRFPPFS